MLACSSTTAVSCRRSFGPRLLIATLATTVIGDWFGRVTTLCDVLGEIALTDGPAAEGRNVHVVGADRSRTPALASEMARVLTEMARVQFVERRHDVFVVGKEVDEPTELSTRILTVVPALAAGLSPCSEARQVDCSCTTGFEIDIASLNFTDFYV